MAVGDLVREVYVRGGWGSTPPDEVGGIIERDRRLTLSPLDTVVPGDAAAQGPRGAEVTAWNRARIRRTVDIFKNASPAEIQSAIEMLGNAVSPEALAGVEALGAFARGDAATDGQAATNRILTALLSEPDKS